MDKINIILLKIPFFNSIYLKIITLYKTKSILGLFLLTFLGSLFFLGFPGEVIYFIYIKAGYNILLISFLMIFSSLLAQIVNYLIGFFIEKKWLDSYIKEEKKHYKKSIKQYDSLFIVVFNILPLPADLLSVFLGLVKYDFKKMLFFTFIGKIFKYVFLIFIYFILNYALLTN
ncbi:MAG: VTT domain-containing protein [Candidatus Woesearchaeota archaeon]